MPRQLRVFLCHASQDKPAVRELYQRLKAENWIDPWLDEEKLLGGQDFDLEIYKATRDADAIIICLSKKSVLKEGYVNKEIRRALDIAEEKREGSIYVIPLRLDECFPSFEQLKKLHWVDYFSSNAHEKLLDSLRARAVDLKIKIYEKKTIEPPTKRVLFKFDLRWLGIGGIILLFIFLGSLGLNSFLNNPPVETAIPTSQVITETPKPPTDTKAPVTSTPEPTETVVPTPTLGIGSTMISEKDGMTLVFVPAGEFIMGSDSYPDAQPVHRVFLDGYWIDRTEVTNEMYDRCVVAGQCNPKQENDSDAPNYPVVFVSWYDAIDYCKYAGRRLPTEAEWEKAARGENGYTYPWGDKDPQGYLVNSNGNDGIYNDVGSYPAGASVYGALDMAGSVSEWVNSLYAPYPYDASDGREDLSSFEDRVIRGSSTMSINREIPSALRGGEGADPTLSAFILGFRCALSQP